MKAKFDPLASPACPTFRRLFSRQHLCAWLFISPALLGFLLFYFIPTLRAVSIALTDWNLLQPSRFVGGENFRRLAGDARFWESVRVTLLYVLYNIPLQTALALGLAVLLDRSGRSNVMRGIVLIPFLLSNVIVATLWYWLLDPVLGYGNTLLAAVGLGRHAFFSDEQLALPTLAGINIWRHAGFNALLFYTGLQAIPRHLYEAAYLEGAGSWRIFRTISLPLLRPVLAFVLVTSVIGSFQVFDTIAVTTQGGPGSSTRTVMWYIYESAFGSFRMGYASAMSCVLFVGLVAVTLLQMRLLRANQTDLE